MTFPVEVVSLAGYSEEEKAVAMAKCSRSSNTFMQDAEETRAKGNAGKFNETVVVNYGHNSVADMSIASLCFEHVSTLLAEEILDIPTGKYQGKSSRYVPFTRDRVVQPFRSNDHFGSSWGQRVADAHHSYNDTINKLFNAYEGLQPRVRAWVEAQPGWAPGEAKESAITARVFDALRYLLPLGALTNLGTRLSGRDTAELLRRLLVSPLAEAQDLAAKIKAVSDNETPTLVRHAVYKPIYAAVRNVFKEVPAEYFDNGEDKGPFKEPYAALIQSFGDSWDVVTRTARLERGRPTDWHLWTAQKAEMYAALDTYMASRKTRHDPIPQGYRAVRYCFELEADFGTWKDLRRHRRNENPHAPFTAEHGYIVSDDVQAIGGDVLAEYIEAADAATAAFKELTELGFPAEAQYIITHGAIQRWEMDMDAEQLLYIAELRTEPFGHISYRRIARQMFDLAREVHPELYRHHLVHDVDGVGAHN